MSAEVNIKIIQGVYEAFGSAMEVEEFTLVSIAANDTDVHSLVRFRSRSRGTGKRAAMNLHHFFALLDGKIAYYRGTETAAVLRA